MARFSRRSFLTKVGIGLVAFIPAARALTRSLPSLAQPPAPPPISLTPPPDPPPVPTTVNQNPDPRYAEGIATSVTSSAILIETLRAGSTKLNLFAQTEVWDGYWVGQMPIEVGDEIIGWGKRQDDGSLDVDKLYVNYANVKGTVSSVSSDTAPINLVLQDRRLGMQHVTIDPNSRYPDSVSAVPGQLVPRSPVGGRKLPVHAGGAVEAIGRRMKDGSILAVTFFIDS